MNQVCGSIYVCIVIDLAVVVVEVFGIAILVVVGFVMTSISGRT